MSERPSQNFFLVTPNFVRNPSGQLAYEAKLSLVTLVISQRKNDGWYLTEEFQFV